MALVLTTLASGLWTALLLVNLQISPKVPWAVGELSVLLWSMWQYAGGRWWPSKTSPARRALLRANRVSPRVFTMALVSGPLATCRRRARAFWRRSASRRPKLCPRRPKL